MPKLVLAHSIGVIDLVAQHEEGRLAQVLHAEQRVELGLALGEALRVLCVDEEHDAADLGEVVLPQAAGLLVAAQVEGVEAHAADGELFGRRVQGGLEDCDAVVLEHVEELREGGVSGTALLVCEGSSLLLWVCVQWSCRRCRGRGRAVWRACLPARAGRACPKLHNGISVSILLPVCLLLPFPSALDMRQPAV
jgi:hypothetical protein